MPPANLPDPAMSEPVVAGIDIGGTNLRIGLVDRDSNLYGSQRVSSQTVLAGEHPLAALSSYLDVYLKDALEKGHELAAISIGFPSTVDASRRKVISTSNIPGINDLDVPAALSTFGVPVLIDRDVNMLLRHDIQRLGFDKTPGVIFGCYLGTGVGSAFAIDGKILVGKHGVAGELGHIPFPGVETVCGCGNIGCSEAVASGKALRRQLKAHHPDIPIREVFTRCVEEPFVQQWIEYVAATMATAINILDPAGVIVGGGVAQTEGFPKAGLEAALHRMARKPMPANDLTLHYARAGHNNGVLGAAIYAFEQNPQLAGFAAANVHAHARAAHGRTQANEGGV